MKIPLASVILVVSFIITAVLAVKDWEGLTNANAALGREEFHPLLSALGICAIQVVPVTFFIILVWRTRRDRMQPPA
jgi:hypothetical protein